jgi:hypothetical protein
MGPPKSSDVYSTLHGNHGRTYQFISRAVDPFVNRTVVHRRLISEILATKYVKEGWHNSQAERGEQMQILVSLAVGVTVGIISGLIGLGGGVFLIPLLVYAYGMDQHRAQGTSLAVLLLPIGALAFWKYYSTGNVDVKIAVFIAVGFFVGGYFGGAWAQHLSNLLLRRIFAVSLVVVAVKMFLQK